MNNAFLVQGSYRNVKMADEPVHSQNQENSASIASENRLLLECYRDMQAGKLKLPTIPEISIKIRRTINSAKANNNKIAKVVQMDPAITARLIQVSNSPLYRGYKKIESCPESLTRLGLRAAQDLITSFSLRSVFKAKSSYIRQRMNELWNHSSYVASICAVLAHKTPGFDPDRAMLAGLIHDIGVVPILTYADRHPELGLDANDLKQTIQKLRGEIGAMIIREWDFPTDFEDVVLNAENWYRDTKPEPDYTDLVIISQLHSFVGRVSIHKYPRMDKLPAYRKIVSGDLDADLSINILDIAKDDIGQIQQMLTS